MRYLTRKRADGFSVISALTGSVAVVNGKLLDDLDEDEADDFADLINCVEGESLLDIEDADPQIAIAVPLRDSSASRLMLRRAFS